MAKDHAGSRGIHKPNWKAAPAAKKGMPDGLASRDFGFWPDHAGGSVGEVRVPVRQRPDAADLHESRRASSAKLPNDGMPDDGANDRADPTSATAAARDLRVFATAGAPRLSLGALLRIANLRDRALHSIDESNGEHQPVALDRRRRAVIA